MTSKNYPKEIYRADDIEGGIVVIASVRKMLEKAYDLGYENGRLDGGQDHLEPGALWTRLNRSHPDWGRIDWAALYKRPAILIHSTSMSVIATEVASKGPYSVSYDDGPRETPAHQALLLKALPTMTHSSLHGATQAALDSLNGWALYICGDLPLRKLTADELEPGTCFTGKHPGVHDGVALNCIVVEQPNGMPKMAIYTNPITNQRASEVEVVEVYGLGTFQTPKGGRMSQPVTTKNPNMDYRESDADFARRMGYTPGTVLVGNEGYGDTYLTITAIGQEKILAQAWDERHGHRREGKWPLRFRDWQQVDALPAEASKEDA